MADDSLRTQRRISRAQSADELRERLVAIIAHALASRSDLTDEEYDAGREGLGDEALFELTTLVGYYATLALQLRVFRVPVPGEAQAALDTESATGEDR